MWEKGCIAKLQRDGFLLSQKCLKYLFQYREKPYLLNKMQTDKDLDGSEEKTWPICFYEKLSEAAVLSPTQGEFRNINKLQQCQK